MEKPIAYGVYESMIGTLKIGYTDTAIRSIGKLIEEKTLTNQKKSELSNQAFMQLEEYFRGERKVFSFPYEYEGTVFQKQVWQELCKIPYGETRSYKQIAEAIGNPKACRAVGMANNKNPLAIVIPCHRVIGITGKLVGYEGGLDMKVTLLEIEKNKIKYVNENLTGTLQEKDS